MGIVQSSYVSEHTRWMAEQMAKHPQWREEQVRGRSLWWDKAGRNAEGADERAFAEARLAQAAYPYDVNFSTR